jgi:hypothetical protein
VVATAPGAKPQPLAQRDAQSIKWAPDSKRIVAQLLGDGDVDALVSVEVASGKEATLARGRFWGWSISPDGTQVVFARAHGEAPGNDVFPVLDLYVTNVDGSGESEPITDTGDSAYPVWGPKSIAFAKLMPVQGMGPDTEFARNEIWRIQPDGTGRKTISGPLPERFVKGLWHCIGLDPFEWSKDSSALLASVDCEGFGETVAVDAQTGAIRLLGAGSFTAGLSRDGRFALVEWGDAGRLGIEKVRVLMYPWAGGKPDVLVRGADEPSWNR